MSSRGDSLSLFVVQRTFRLIRRGYDPEEVDRHLEQVSRWFVSTGPGEALSHERAALQDRERAVGRREADAAHIIEGARRAAAARGLPRTSGGAPGGRQPRGGGAPAGALAPMPRRHARRSPPPA